MHYYLHANHHEALKLAMMVGDTFEVGRVEKKVGKEDLDILTTAIYNAENVPSKDKIMNFLDKVEMDNNQMILIQEILSELDIAQKPSTFCNPTSSVAKGDETEVNMFSYFS